jgi:hypothetical protein
MPVEIRAWDNTADLSFGCLAPYQWQAIHLSDLYPPNLAFNVTDGQIVRRNARLRSADPSLQTAGAGQTNGSNVNGTGQSDGPTKDHIAVFALNLSRTLTNRSSTLVFAPSVGSPRPITPTGGIVRRNGSTTFGVYGNQGSQSALRERRTERRAQDLSTPDSQFNAPRSPPPCLRQLIACSLVYLNPPHPLPDCRWCEPVEKT